MRSKLIPYYPMFSLLNADPYSCSLHSKHQKHYIIGLHMVCKYKSKKETKTLKACLISFDSKLHFSTKQFLAAIAVH